MEIANKEELAVTYAALILHDEGLAITADKISILTKAANVSVQKFWPTLFAKALEGKDIDQLLLCGGGVVGGGAGGRGEGGGGVVEVVEEEENVEIEEESEEMDMDIFGFGDDEY